MTLSDTLTANERMPFYQAIASLDPSKSIVICDSAADTLSYSAAVHSTEKITGRPNDEELVRALLLLHLINTYSYVLDTISLETRTPKAKGITSRETDICI